RLARRRGRRRARRPRRRAGAARGGVRRPRVAKGTPWRGPTRRPRSRKFALQVTGGLTVRGRRRTPHAERLPSLVATRWQGRPKRWAALQGGPLFATERGAVAPRFRGGAVGRFWASNKES